MKRRMALAAIGLLSSILAIAIAGCTIDVPWIETELRANIAASCANCEGELTGYAPLYLAFDGTGSIGDIVGYSWDFGDGATAEGAVVTHTYRASGIFEVTLVVTDRAGKTATAKTVVLVLSQDKGRAVTKEGEMVSVTVQAPERVRLGDRFLAIVTITAKQDLSYVGGTLGFPSGVVTGGTAQWIWNAPREGDARTWRFAGEVFLTLEKGSAILAQVNAVAPGYDEEIKLWVPIAMEEEG